MIARCNCTTRTSNCALLPPEELDHARDAPPDRKPGRGRAGQRSAVDGPGRRRRGPGAASHAQSRVRRRPPGKMGRDAANPQRHFGQPHAQRGRLAEAVVAGPGHAGQGRHAVAANGRQRSPSRPKANQLHARAASKPQPRPSRGRRRRIVAAAGRQGRRRQEPGKKSLAPQLGLPVTTIASSPPRKTRKTGKSKHPRTRSSTKRWSRSRTCWPNSRRSPTN